MAIGYINELLQPSDKLDGRLPNLSRFDRFTQFLNMVYGGYVPSRENSYSWKNVLNGSLIF